MVAPPHRVNFVSNCRSEFYAHEDHSSLIQLRVSSLISTKGTHMEITSFKDMYLSELQELASVEDQLAESLLHMAEVASHPTLKNALLHHREETQVQKDRLDSILQKHGVNPKAHTDQAMEALLKEHAEGKRPSRCGTDRIRPEA
jgi:hypothetical protein